MNRVCNNCIVVYMLMSGFDVNHEIVLLLSGWKTITLSRMMIDITSNQADCFIIQISKSDATDSVFRSNCRTKLHQDCTLRCRLWISIVYQTIDLESTYSWSLISWTHCGFTTPHGNIWVNIGSSDGLLPDDTKALPESMLTYHWSGSVALI